MKNLILAAAVVLVGVGLPVVVLVPLKKADDTLRDWAVLGFLFLGLPTVAFVIVKLANFLDLRMCSMGGTHDWYSQVEEGWKGCRKCHFRYQTKVVRPKPDAA